MAGVPRHRTTGSIVRDLEGVGNLSRELIDAVIVGLNSLFE
jgi:hypothetical protein